MHFTGLSNSAFKPKKLSLLFLTTANIHTITGFQFVLMEHAAVMKGHLKALQSTRIQVEKHHRNTTVKFSFLELISPRYVNIDLLGDCSRSIMTSSMYTFTLFIIRILFFFLYPQSPAVTVNKEIFKEYICRSLAQFVRRYRVSQTTKHRW